jgi:aryl-alcohol dehydrogenase-like predicted oxidoreductase
MRLSTAPERDDARAVSVIHAALDAGATLVDTANVYCHDETEIGRNERLVAQALQTWRGDRSTIEIATKGGLTRPGGKWIPDGKVKALRAACDASRRALGVDVIDLYQLHAVDPRTPLETSVRALAALQTEGKINRIGLCNVTVGQLESARRIAEIASVQVSLSPLDDENLRNGVAEDCRDHGIRLIAYRPLGGERAARLARDPVLTDVAARLGVTAAEVALAWLADFGPGVIPIPGPTREETARSIAAALRVRLTDDDRRALDERFSGRFLRVPRSERRPPADAGGDVVLVMGMPGAGKSTIARELESSGYARLNRDARGGTLANLVTELDAGLRAGKRRWVLDNTYPSRRSRNDVIECAWRHGVPVRCVWLATPVADAQVNVITRLIEIHGSLPTPQVIRERGRDDPRYFGPDAQFRYERAVERPTIDEGFTALEERPFVRQSTPNAGRRAIIIDFDDLSRSHGEALRQYVADGWLLFAHAWRPRVARGEMTSAAVDDEFARARDALGVDITFAYCPHDAGPPICWCRKPLPGSVLEFALRRGVALERSVIIGHSAADRTMADRLGATFRARLVE